MNEDVDFSGAWETFWSQFAPGVSPELLRLLSWVGVVLVVFAVVKWFYTRSSGSGARTDHLPYVLALGATMSAPGAILPLIARVADAIVNPILRALN